MKKEEYEKKVKLATKNDPVARQYFLDSKVGQYRNSYVINLAKTLPKTKSILNVGDGTGTLSLQMEKIKFKNITSIDINKKYLSIAKLRCKHTKFTYANAHDLPFKDNSFDLITYVDVVEFLDIQKTLKEASRVLKKGGVIYIENFNSYVLKKLASKPILDKLIVTEKTYKTNYHNDLYLLFKKHGFQITKFGCLLDMNPKQVSILKRIIYKTLDNIKPLKERFCPVTYFYLKKTD